MGTDAGTDIESGMAEAYHDNRVDYSNTVTVIVSQGYGMNLYAPVTTEAVLPGESYYFPHTLTNVGNGSDIYRLELSNTTDNWNSTLVKDDNFNGVHEAGETTPVENEVRLAEDAAYYFFVVLTAPADLREQETGSTTLGVAGSVSDGGIYLGANGLYYGGPDTGDSTVFAQVLYVDNNPPTISDLTINGRKRFPDDIISSRLRVESTILDDEPINVARIEIWLNNTLMYEGASSDWKGAYDEQSGKLEIELDPLDPGEYSFRIIAWDRTGNQVEQLTEPLYVNDPADIRIVGPPLNYPNPFAPLKDEKTALAYVLTTDAPVTIYIYNIIGSAVWRRTYNAFEEGGKAGYNEVTWNGRSDFKRVLGNGIYIFKVVHNNRVIGSGKITILDSK